MNKSNKHIVINLNFKTIVLITKLNLNKINTEREAVSGERFDLNDILVG